MPQIPEDQPRSDRAAEASQSPVAPAPSPMTWDEIVAAVRSLPEPDDLTWDDVPAVAHLAALLGLFGGPSIDLEALKAASRQPHAEEEPDEQQGKQD